MLIVIVHVHVKTECIEAFKIAAMDNASHTLKEPGVARFDVLQLADDPARFVLNEEYLDEDAVKAHKETAHYLHWRDTVADMMAEPRQGLRYTKLFPSHGE